MTDCIFCKIANKEFPSHTVWENDTHMAFLSIFPNTDGFTVVIPKKHYSSYVFDQSDAVIKNLVFAAKTVAKKIDAAFPDVGRTGMVFEGFGVDHLHAKLIPMHGTADMKTWKQISSKRDDRMEQYAGYLSTHDATRADDVALEIIAARIRKA